MSERFLGDQNRLLGVKLLKRVSGLPQKKFLGCQNRQGLPKKKRLPRCQNRLSGYQKGLQGCLKNFRADKTGFQVVRQSLPGFQVRFGSSLSYRSYVSQLLP